MLGYMTKAQAKEMGFTHTGSYYGIPCYLGDPEGECRVAVTWWPLDFLFDIATVIESWLYPLVHGHDAMPTFMFKVTGEL